MSRRPEKAASHFGEGFEVVGGDVEEPSSLERAMDGCTAVHVNIDGRGDWDLERRGAVNVAAVAARLGLTRITSISGASTCEENCWFPMVRAKFDAETAISDSGVQFTIFRCTMFMELLPKFVRGSKAFVMGHQPTRWHWVAAADYARMVATSYSTAEALGKTLFVYGPEALTMEDAVAQYCTICAPHAKPAQVPFWVLSIMALMPGRQELRRVGLPLMRYFSKVRETGDPDEANALLGAPTTTVDAWCRARAG
jgi:uncharacterized protein YbjT (DUF2867 family)